MQYFKDCFTVDEIKTKYRYWALKLHPDVGGNPDEFKNMKLEYDHRIAHVTFEPLIPEYFNFKSNYEYHRQPIKYTGRNNHYYLFERLSGCFVMIDVNNVNLIWEKQKRL